MNISGSTRVFLILGDPVAQVKAPQAFNHLFREHGVDAVLVPAHVAPADLAGFATHALKARNIDGLWLTIPHKSSILPLLDRCDAVGQAAGAVNAVRRNADGSLEGALFDGVGFTKALDHWAIPIEGQRILVVGVGGAGVAIAASLAARRAGFVGLYARKPGPAIEVAARLREHFACEVGQVATPDPAGYDLVINATPLGLEPGDPLAFDVSRLDADASVVDILMKNQPTPLLRACEARGIRAYPGFEMLIQQVPEYLAFFGLEDLSRNVAADLSGVRALFGD